MRIGEFDQVTSRGIVTSHQPVHASRVAHLPTIDDGHRITKRREFAENVGTDEDCFTQRPQLLKNLHEFNPRTGIKSAGRLIEQQEIGIVYQRASKTHTLLHPSGKAADQIVPAARHIGQGKDVGNRPCPLGRRDSIRRPEEIEILKNGHLPVHAEVILHVSHPPAHFFEFRSHVVAEHRHPALLRFDQSRKHFERSGLSRTVRPDESVNRLPADRETHVFDCLVRFVGM